MGEPDAAAARLRHPSARARQRLDTVFASDDPSEELAAAWGVKEQLRRLHTIYTVEQARTEKMILGCYVLAADMEETWRLWNTIEAWWPAIEVLIEHRVTNARTEVANTGIKQIKRTGRDTEIRPAIKPYPAQQRRPTRGVNPLTWQGATVNCNSLITGRTV
jgi:hypothetical protein